MEKYEDRQHQARAARPDDDGIMTLRDYAGACARHRVLLMGVTLLVFVLGVAYAVTHRPLYKATARVLVTTHNGAGVVDDMPLLADVQALTRNRSVETQVQMINSYDLLNAAYQSLPAQVRTRDFGSETLPEWAVRISGKRDTDIIEISARARRAESASLLANRIAEFYFARDIEQSIAATRQVRGRVEATMESVGDELTQAQMALAQYKQQRGIIELPTHMQQTTQQLSTLQRDIDEARAQLAGSEQATQALQRQLAAEQATVVASSTVVNNPRFANILERIDQLQGERVTLLQEYTPQAMPVATIDARIQEEQSRLQAVAQTLLGSQTQARNPVRDELMKQFATAIATRESAAARTRVLEQSFATRRVSANLLPEQERRLGEFSRQVGLLDNTYAVLAQKYYALLVNEQAKLPNGRIIEQARPPATTTPTRAQLFVFFALLAVCMGIGAALLADRLAPVSMSSPEVPIAAALETNMSTR